MKTAAIYARKSKYTGKGDSIENQIKFCKEYLERSDIDEFIIYKDEGFSGKNFERPEFRKMFKDAKEKKFDILICYRLDRVSRSVADFAGLMQDLEKYEISFISVNEQFDTSTPMGKAMLYIASVFAQLERETIAERIRDNMLELARTGRWLGGRTPTGYESTPITVYDEELNERKMFKLTPIQKELELVKLIFNKYLELKSLSQVVKYLLSNNIKTKFGNNWHKTNVQTILVNPVYVKAAKETCDYLESKGINVIGKPDEVHGLLTYNKRKGKSGGYRKSEDWICAVSKHKGIIDSKQWIEVQELMEKNKSRAPNIGNTKTALLSGIIRCGKCGSYMRINYGQPSPKTGIKPHYYACSMKYNSGGTRCKNKNAPGQIIEEILINKLKKLTVNKGKFIEELEKQKNEIQLSNDFTINIKDIENLISKNNAAIDNLVKSISLTKNASTSKKLVGEIEALTKKNEELEKKLKEMKNKKNEAENEIIDLDIIMQSLKNFKLMIDISNVEEKRMLIGSIVDKIYWDGDTGIMDIKFWGADKKK